MTHILLAIGCQETKLDKLREKDRKKLSFYLTNERERYDSVIAVLRDGNNGGNSKGDTIGTSEMHLVDYAPDNIMLVEGFDLDVKSFRKDAIYDLVGVSTGASVLSIAFSMYSRGLRIRVLQDYCFDRLGCQKEAITIMNKYMPGVVV